MMLKAKGVCVKLRLVALSVVNVSLSILNAFFFKEKRLLRSVMLRYKLRKEEHHLCITSLL